MYQFHIAHGTLYVASFINLLLSLCEVPRQTSGHTPSGLFVPLYRLITRSPILSHLGSSGGTSSGLRLGMGVCFRLLRPILFSISATLALTDVGETSDTPPVVPLELLPPVSTGSSPTIPYFFLSFFSSEGPGCIISKFESIRLFVQLIKSRSFVNSQVKFFSRWVYVLSSALLSNMWV